MLENIYVARHGFRRNWEDPSVMTASSGCHNDPPLAQRGVVQAQHLGLFLSEPPAPLPRPDILYSSPFTRCLETIQPLAKATGKEVHCELGVMEWFSTVIPGSGLHARPSHADELQPHFGDMTLHKTYQSTYHPSRQGETLADMRRRVDSFVGAFVPRVEAEYPDAKTIIICTHAAIVIGLGRALMGEDTHDVLAPTAGFSLYRRKGLAPLGEFEALDLVERDDRYPRRSTSVETSANACISASAESAVLGNWIQLLNGFTDHLPNGSEATWNFHDMETTPDGNVILELGDGKPFTEADLHPVGLAVF